MATRYEVKISFKDIFLSTFFINEKSKSESVIQDFFQKRAQLKIIYSLPKDVWGHIVSFLPVGRDWLNLLVLNGVWYSLMKNVFDLSVLKQLPLRWACLHGHTFFVRELLQDGRVRPEIKYPLMEHPLGIAARKGYSEIVKIFLHHPKIDPTMDDNYPIRIANHFKHYKVVELLQNDPRVKEKLGGKPIKPLFPIPSGNLNEIGWLGLCSREDAELAICNGSAGSFALRWSSNAQTYVLSYISTLHSIVHIAHIEPLPDGKIRILNSDKKFVEYNSIHEYLFMMQQMRIITHSYFYDKPIDFYGSSTYDTR